jgi:hypothetical protein
MPRLLPLLVVTVLFALRMIVSFVHGHAHGMLAVPLAPWQNAFVWLVIVASPTVALVLLWIRPRAGTAWTLAGLLAAGWLFGLYFHFGPANPDHVSHVPQLPGHDVFAATAALLAIVEPIAAASAAWLAWTLNHRAETRHV